MKYSAAICVLLVAFAGVSVQGCEFLKARGMFPNLELVPRLQKSPFSISDILNSLTKQKQDCHLSASTCLCFRDGPRAYVLSAYQSHPMNEMFSWPLRDFQVLLG